MSKEKVLKLIAEGVGRHSVQEIIFVPGTKIIKINSSFMLYFAF
jgi:hypothetical protein